MERKIWFITGISSGLGQALARSVMEAGDLVIGTFRDEAQVTGFNRANPENGFSVVLDITDEHQIQHVIAEVISKYGRIDVLVNNAGVGFVGAIEEASNEETRVVMEENFFGALHLTQAVLPHMRREKISEALAQEVAPLG